MLAESYGKGYRVELGRCVRNVSFQLTVAVDATHCISQLPDVNMLGTSVQSDRLVVPLLMVKVAIDGI